MEIHDRQQFFLFLRTALSAHPDWASEAITAIVTGLADSNQKLQDICAEQNRGLMSALSLINEKRTSQGMKDQMLLFIRRGLLSYCSESHMSPLEKDFMKQTKNLSIETLKN